MKINFKKFGAIALLLVLVGSAFVSVFAVAKTGITIAIIGNIVLLAFATPAIARLFNYIRNKQDFPLEIGDEFTTDQGEHLRVIGFDPDGTPRCEVIL